MVRMVVGMGTVNTNSLVVVSVVGVVGVRIKLVVVLGTQVVLSLTTW